VGRPEGLRYTVGRPEGLRYTTYTNSIATIDTTSSAPTTYSAVAENVHS
jgi:hypothetical protein